MERIMPAHLYFAPLEGITDTKFRVIHATLFPGDADGYFAPFVSPTHESPFVEKDRAALEKENNPGVPGLVPQVLCNQSELLTDIAGKLHDMGYSHIDLNLGCPSGTVVSKRKGAGFLGDPDALDRFFDEAFSSPVLRDGTVSLSVKTRLGMFDPAEFEDILPIYNRYPLRELIVHPRVRTEMYKGVPHRELFPEIVSRSVHPVCCNGDIFTCADWDALASTLPADKPVGLMLGRGAVANPALFRMLRGGAPVTVSDLRAFSSALLDDACGRLSGERHILYRMKELWAYWLVMFEGAAPYAKRLRKAATLTEFRSVTESVLSSLPLRENPGFSGTGDLKNFS